MSSDETISSKFKRLVNKWACEIVGIDDCIQAAKKEFLKITDSNELIKGRSTSKDLRNILCTVIKYGGHNEWNIVFNSIEMDNPNHNHDLFASLGCSREPTILNSYFNLIKNSSFRQYAPAIFKSVVPNQMAKLYGLQYIFENFNLILENVGTSVLLTYFHELSTDFELNIVSSFDVL